MKKILRFFTIISLIILIIISIFKYSLTINEAIHFSFLLFINNIFPSLFPMFLISTMLVDIKIPNLLANVFKNFMNKLFRVKGEGSFVFFMSMITGFPSSAKYINDLLKQDLINEKDACKILTFTFFSNPLFIVNSVGAMFLENKKLGYFILIAHILGNIIIGILFKNYQKTVIINNSLSLNNTLNTFLDNINNTNLFKVLLNGIKDALNTLLSIFGIITSFLIITTLLNESLITNSYLKVFLSGLLEMSSGLKMLSLLDLPTTYKALISTFFISFGGLSVHAQIMNILDTKKVKYLPFLFARFLHAIISVIILLIILIIFNL